MARYTVQLTARNRRESSSGGSRLVIGKALPLIGLTCVLAACGSGSHLAPRATQRPTVLATPDNSCTTQVLSHDSQTLTQYFLTNQAVQTVLGDLQTALTAESAAASATLQADATKLETDAHTAASHPPPACADPAGFEKSMQDLVTVAKDCMLVVNNLRSGNQAAAITHETAISAVLDASNNALGKFTAALGAA